MGTQEEESFKKEAVTKIGKKEFWEEKPEWGKGWTAGKSELEKGEHDQESTPEC